MDPCSRYNTRIYCDDFRGNLGHTMRDAKANVSGEGSNFMYIQKTHIQLNNLNFGMELENYLETCKKIAQIVKISVAPLCDNPIMLILFKYRELIVELNLSKCAPDKLFEDDHFFLFFETIFSMRKVTLPRSTTQNMLCSLDNQMHRIRQFIRKDLELIRV